VLAATRLADARPLVIGGRKVEGEEVASPGVPRKTMGPSRNRSSMPNTAP